MIVDDNGTELTSHAILDWQAERGVACHYIAPSNPHAECFRGVLQRQVPRRVLAWPMRRVSSARRTRRRGGECFGPAAVGDRPGRLGAGRRARAGTASATRTRRSRARRSRRLRRVGPRLSDADGRPRSRATAPSGRVHGSSWRSHAPASPGCSGRAPEPPTPGPRAGDCPRPSTGTA
jgi:hypothetical protein